MYEATVHLWLWLPSLNMGWPHGVWFGGTSQRKTGKRTIRVGCAARRCTQEPPPPFLTPFWHVYGSFTTLCG